MIWKMNLCCVRANVHTKRNHQQQQQQQNSTFDKRTHILRSKPKRSVRSWETHARMHACRVKILQWSTNQHHHYRRVQFGGNECAFAKLCNCMNFFKLIYSIIIQMAIPIALNHLCICKINCRSNDVYMLCYVVQIELNKCCRYWALPLSHQIYSVCGVPITLQIPPAHFEHTFASEIRR